MDSDEEQIRELVQTWMSATKADDLDTVLSLMADDAVFLVAGQPPMIGKEAYAAAARSEGDQGRPRFDGRSEIQEIKVLGDWAYMWTKLRVVATPPGGAQSITRAGYTLSIIKKQNGKWLLARDANMLTTISEAHAAGNAKTPKGRKRSKRQPRSPAYQGRRTTRRSKRSSR